MPRPQYRGRVATALVGDFVAGWLDAEGTQEVAGVVVSLMPEQASGDNLTLAVLEYDLYPPGSEPPPQQPPTPEDRPASRSVVAKDHEGRPYVLGVRLVTANSERLELMHRRTDLPGWHGVMRGPHPDVMAARHGQEEIRRKQHEALQGGGSKAGGPPPIHSKPPEPLPPPPPPAEGQPHSQSPATSKPPAKK